MKRIAAGLLLMLGPSALATAAPGEIAIYRCTHAGGALSIQNMPCPKGTQQQKKMMQTPAATSLPAALPPPPTDAAEQAPAAEPDSEPVDATPPADDPGVPDAPVVSLPQEKLPPLYRCTTPDREQYLGEQEEPPPRCIAMHTTGLGGTPALGGAEACEVVRDRCERIAEEHACDGWREYAAAAEQRWRFGASAAADGEAYAAFERAQHHLAAAGCIP